MLRKILLIRHAESVGNLKRILAGQIDHPLSEKGRIQARLLGKRLASEKITLIYSSPLKRALETAEQVARNQRQKRPRMEIVPELAELHHGDYQGLTRTEVPEDARRKMEEFPVDVTFRPPNGESWLDLSRRVSGFARSVLLEGREDGTIAIVSHGGTLTAILCRVLGVPLERNRVIGLSNASLVEIERSPSGHLRISSFNDLSHLPSGLRRRKNEKALRLLFARHAETKGNVDGRIYGTTDYPLTAKGLLQARELARRLVPEKVRSIYSSPLRRSLDTAREIQKKSPNAKLIVSNLLMERGVGKFEGRKMSEYSAWKSSQRNWDSERESRAGIEPWSKVSERAGKFLSPLLKQRERTIVIVSHGGMSRALLGRLLGVKASEMNGFILGNTALAEVAIGDTFTRLASFNDRSHLPKRLS